MAKAVHIWKVILDHKPTTTTRAAAMEQEKMAVDEPALAEESKTMVINTSANDEKGPLTISHEVVECPTT